MFQVIKPDFFARLSLHMLSTAENLHTLENVAVNLLNGVYYKKRNTKNIGESCASILVLIRRTFLKRKN